MHVGSFARAPGDPHHRDPRAGRSKLRNHRRRPRPWSLTRSGTSIACSSSSPDGTSTCAMLSRPTSITTMSPERPELCRVTGATLVIPAGESVGYPRRSIADGEEIELGALRLVARHTPGHTPTHMTYVLEDDGRPVAAFTGGSMLLGSVGRTDLAGPWVTDRLSHLQHRSVRRLSKELADNAAILPTHGFGSLCGAGFPVGAPDTADAGHQRAENPALLMDEDPFVARLVSGLDAFPRYYALHRTEKPRGCWDDRPRAAGAERSRRARSTRRGRGMGDRSPRASRFRGPAHGRHARIRALATRSRRTWAGCCRGGAR